MSMARSDGTEHLEPALMRGWVHRWAAIVDRQYGRAREYEFHGDLDLFALALRNLLRAVEEAQKETGSTVLADALAEFYQQIPHAKPIRDILEHFDQYERGTGRWPGRARPEFISKATWITTEPDGEQVRRHPNFFITLGDYQLSVTPAYEAAMALADRALEHLST